MTIHPLKELPEPPTRSYYLQESCKDVFVRTHQQIHLFGRELQLPSEFDRPAQDNIRRLSGIVCVFST